MAESGIVSAQQQQRQQSGSVNSRRTRGGGPSHNTGGLGGGGLRVKHDDGGAASLPGGRSYRRNPSHVFEMMRPKKEAQQKLRGAQAGGMYGSKSSPQLHGGGGSEDFGFGGAGGGGGGGRGSGYGGMASHAEVDEFRARTPTAEEAAQAAVTVLAEKERRAMEEAKRNPHKWRSPKKKRVWERAPVPLKSTEEYTSRYVEVALVLLAACWLGGAVHFVWDLFIFWRSSAKRCGRIFLYLTRHSAPHPSSLLFTYPTTTTNYHCPHQPCPNSYSPFLLPIASLFSPFSNPSVQTKT